MLETTFLFWFSSILIVIQNFGLSRGIFVEKWIEQKLDHFDPHNRETWNMRYVENTEFYHQHGPIFIMINGESPITLDCVVDNSFMRVTAAAHRAMMYSTEHRYYGKSHPVPNTSLKNLKYLSVSQALEDIAVFIKTKKKELNNPNAFTMVFGCSYAGNLAAWMRVAYPSLVQGALASSAPVYLKADFSEFYRFVGDTIRKSDENCARNIKEAFSAVEDYLRHPKKLADDFKLCGVPNYDEPSEAEFLILTLAEMFADALVDFKIETNGKTSIENLCILMRKTDKISAYQRLVEVFKKQKLTNWCINLRYHSMIEVHKETSWISRAVTGRLWFYQICTELGGHPTLSSPRSIFGSLVDKHYGINLCEELFQSKFNPNHMNNKLKIINSLYSSKLSKTKNIIFTNGNLDPFRSISVLSDLNADSLTIINKDISETERDRAIFALIHSQSFQNIFQKRIRAKKSHQDTSSPIVSKMPRWLRLLTVSQ